MSKSPEFEPTEAVSRQAAEEEIESIESTNMLGDINEVDLNSLEACRALTRFIARREEQIELLNEGTAERTVLLNQNAQLTRRVEEEKDHILQVLQGLEVDQNESLPSELVDRVVTRDSSGLVIAHGPIPNSDWGKTLKEIFRRLRKYELSEIQAEREYRRVLAEEGSFFGAPKVEMIEMIRGKERIRRRRLMVHALRLILWDLRHDSKRSRRGSAAFSLFDNQWDCTNDDLHELDKAVEAANSNLPVFKNITSGQWIEHPPGPENPHEWHLQRCIDRVENLFELLLRAFERHAQAVRDARRKAGQASVKARREAREKVHKEIRSLAQKLLRERHPKHEIAGTIQQRESYRYLTKKTIRNIIRDIVKKEN